MKKKAQPTQLQRLPIFPALLKHHEHPFGEALKRWISARKVPPVILLTGPSGIGKRSIAMHMAQCLLCERSPFFPQETDSLFGPATAATPNEELPCGECGACQRALSGNWVDFLPIGPETLESGRKGSIRIDALRDLQASQGFGPSQGGFKLVLIHDAESMTPQAANSLLKIVEEPPAKWIFILTTTDPSVLLPTLVSRCQQMRIRPIPISILEELLKEAGVEKSRIHAAARQGQGSFGKALEWSKDSAWEQRTRLLKFLDAPKRELLAVLDWAAQDHENLTLTLDLFENLLHDLIQHTVSHSWTGENLKTHHQNMVTRLGSMEAARSFWLERTDSVNSIRRQIHAPLNRKILVQDLLLPWTAV